MALTQVVSELNQLRADGLISAYAIGGAIAAQVYIESTSTEDVDVFVVVAGEEATSNAWLRRIYPYLTERGAKVNDGYLEIGDWPVQFLPAASPLYADAISTARTIPFGDQIGSVMGPEHLAAIALETGRAKDHVRLVEFINTKAVDMTVLETLIERFGLAGKWKDFQLKFLANR